MGRRRNKLKNAAGLIGLSFFRHEYRIVKITQVGCRTRSEDQFLYAKVQFILVPPHFQLIPPHYVCLVTALNCTNINMNYMNYDLDFTPPLKFEQIDILLNKTSNDDTAQESAQYGAAHSYSA